jgi:hypothetical protein
MRFRPRPRSRSDGDTPTPQPASQPDLGVPRPGARGDPRPGDGGAAGDGGPARIRTPRRRYAPVVRLAPGELHQPMAAVDFVAGARLRWSHDGCPDHLLADRGTVDPSRLGSGDYRHRTATALCRHSGPDHASNQRVRPYDLFPDSNEGMYLDLADDLRSGRGPTAPVYVDHLPGDHLTYWFFYGYNDAPAAFSVLDLFDHEGDWERISIRLDDDDSPVAVAYFQHNGYCVLPWDRVPRSGTHPVVYSARGTPRLLRRRGQPPDPGPGLPGSGGRHRRRGALVHRRPAAPGGRPTLVRLRRGVGRRRSRPVRHRADRPQRGETAHPHRLVRARLLNPRGLRAGRGESASPRCGRRSRGPP